MRARLTVLAVAIAFATPVGGAAASPPASVASRVAQMDCANVGADDVAVLAQMPAPRVVALQGSVALITMEPFADFLEAMGYPRDRLVNPVDGARSYSSFVDSRRLAGNLAWYYEREGLMPMLIGHSQGGMVVIKLLHDLAGTRSRAPIPVWNPHLDVPEARTAIVDPHSRELRPVTGLKVNYAAVLATGSLPRLLLGQWGILPLLRDVPDAAVDFTGFSIPWDPIAGNGPHPPPFLATGSARVRNVVLPSSYSHIGLPRAAHLASQPAVRASIEAYRPRSTPDAGAAESATGVASGDVSNFVHAADIWYSMKLHWCNGAKRFAGARSDAARR